MTPRSWSRVRGSTRLVVPLVLLVGCALLELLAIKTPLKSYDEGIALFNAVRVLRGDVPYRDFWAIYPPGQWYALAAVFRVFGEGVLIARLYDVLVRVGIAVCVYWGALALVPVRLAVLPALATALMLAAAGFYGYVFFPALLLNLLALLAVVRFARAGHRRWLLASGLAIGFAALFRIDVAAYGGVSVVLAVASLEWAVGWKAARTFAARALMVTGGALIVAGPIYALLAATVGLHTIWQDLIVFPATTLQEVRHLPYPPIVPGLGSAPAWPAGLHPLRQLLRWLQFYVPLAVYGAALVVLARDLLKRTVERPSRRAAAVAATVLGIGLFMQALSRYDRIHVLPTSIIAVLVGGWLLHRLLLVRWHGPARVAVAGGLTAVIAGLYVVLPAVRLGDLTLRHPPLGCYSSLARSGCVAVAPGAERAVDFIRARTSRTAPVFVGNQRHDLIFVNDMSFDFLADRPSPTRYQHLIPGVATTLPVQRTIVAELESANVQWAVLVNEQPRRPEPNGSSVSSSVTFLDDFIRSHFVEVATFGRYQVWARRR